MERKITNKKIFTALILALTLAVALPTTMSVDAAGAKLNKTKVTVCTGKTYTLKMSGVSKKVSWTTSNKKIVSVTKKSGKKAEKCTIKANKKGTATVTAKVGKKKYKATVKVAGHKYGKVTYKWNKDYSKCTASKKCSRCGKTLKQTVKTTSKTTKKATCEEQGTKKYTAKFTKYNLGTKTKSVSVKKKNHTLKKVKYTWKTEDVERFNEYGHPLAPGKKKVCVASAKCSVCGYSISEKVDTTKTTVTPATKTATGKGSYVAKFKNKNFKTQTKDFKIPKLAYLTLNGKEVNQISVGYGKPVTVTMCNDTIEHYNFTWYGTKTYPAQHWPNGNFDSTGAYTTYETETKDWPATKGTVGKINGNQLTISTKDKPAEEENLKLTITTSGGQTIQYAVKVMFTPGEYNFGRIGTLPTGGYRGYGKQKGTYGNDGYYIMDCNTKKDYDDAYRFYHERKDRNGSICDLEQKTQDIYSECYERSLWKATNSSVKEDMINEGYDPNNIDDIYLYAELHPAYGRMVFGNLYDTQGNFNKNITSQSQVDAIVTDWANEYNNGVLPSWYYPTVFSDWAVWSGRDLGLN